MVPVAIHAGRASVPRARETVEALPVHAANQTLSQVFAPVVRENEKCRDQQYRETQRDAHHGLVHGYPCRYAPDTYLRLLPAFLTGARPITGISIRTQPGARESRRLKQCFRSRIA